MSELAVVETGSTLALEPDQTFWTDKQVAGLRQLGVDRATNGDLAVFMHVCQRTGLDPFARQIYMIERQGKQTIQTGIDGFRLVARRAVDHTGETLSIGASEWCDQDGVWHDVWLNDYPPAAARVVVFRNGEPFPGTALWREYAQTKRDGDLTAMWASRPAGQLAKCAEALALRRAFPHDLSGIYTDDELANERREQRRRSRLGDALNQTSGASGETPAATSSTEGEAGSTPAGAAPDASESPLLNTGSKLAKAMYAAIRDAGITKDETPGLYQQVVGREVTSSKELTDDEARAVLDHLKAIIENPFPDEPVDAELVTE